MHMLFTFGVSPDNELHLMTFFSICCLSLSCWTLLVVWFILKAYAHVWEWIRMPCLISGAALFIWVGQTAGKKWYILMHWSYFFVSTMRIPAFIWFPQLAQKIPVNMIRGSVRERGGGGVERGKMSETVIKHYTHEPKRSQNKVQTSNNKNTRQNHE